MDEKEQVEQLKARYQESIDACNKKIQTYQERLKTVPEGSLAYDSTMSYISKQQRQIEDFQERLKYVRPHDEEDMKNRRELLTKFRDAVRDLYPDGYPIAFHGCCDLGRIEKILKSGGLLTPEERGVDFESFATGIDVTYKVDIGVTCEFAEPEVRGEKHMPYGAIFAVRPKEDEIENVVGTKGREVMNGIGSVKFREEPDRLIAIITTKESAETIKNWCRQYGIDESKVQTHKQFLEKQAEELNEQEDDRNTRMWRYENLVMFNNEAPIKSKDIEPEKEVGISRESHP